MQSLDPFPDASPPTHNRSQKKVGEGLTVVMIHFFLNFFHAPPFCEWEVMHLYKFKEVWLAFFQTATTDPDDWEPTKIL